MKQKDQIVTVEHQALVSQFLDLYTKGIEMWTKAGEALVALLESNPDAYELIIENCPHLNPEILGRFEQMGRKMIHPRLLVESSPGFDRLANLPISIQTRHLEDPIPLVVETPTGTDTLLVHARNMTTDQAKQVFASNHIRSEGEQKAWLVSQRSKKIRKTQPSGGDSPWKIKNGRVYFLSDCSFSPAELATLLAQVSR